ncbi:Halogenase [Hyella patelloides LEGE 07179]|uniref:Halogenase n=1 Tax=Hyella patelloides LEGE 07179 TaxID=945734 RepID=A0A563VWY1_9CYAN|nr:NAD(P)/FAD-dependent oxidoreductase [Hyella patelloides]VEP15962.1 Halogenase [Hyella patelloides LEGE 07179]
MSVQTNYNSNYLGSNHLGKSSRSEYQVVVIGAGPQGILYASWLKQARPELQVIVLERETKPKFKIGESTLSGFCKALRSVGISQEALQLLFFPKNGLGFFHVDESIAKVTEAPEYILETFDETFQVERRLLDGLLIANARRLGVEVIQGAKVELANSEFSARGNQIVYRYQQQKYELKSRLVVDASGPASVIARHLGLYNKENVNFQSNAVWGYFKNLNRLGDRQDWSNVAQFSRDEYTQHFCFREGWMWYIPLISWENVPDAQSDSILNRFLGSEAQLPTKEELAALHGCPEEDVVSIGMVLRQDRDSQFAQGRKVAFDHYASKYPAIQQMLGGAELISDLYGTQQPLRARANIRGYAEQIVGDGWLSIGEAAFFVDPLISPGLTGGVATAYFAAQSTLKALDNENFSRQMFTDYEFYARKLYEALERDNQLVYMSFNHPQAIELIQRFQEIDARRHFNQHICSDYSLADTNVWGILNPLYQSLQKQLWQIMRQAEITVGEHKAIEEQSIKDYEFMVEQINVYLSSYLNSHLELTPYITQNEVTEKLETELAFVK